MSGAQPLRNGKCSQTMTILVGLQCLAVVHVAAANHITSLVSGARMQAAACEVIAHGGDLELKTAKRAPYGVPIWCV